MQNIHSTAPVSSDVTNTTAEPTKAVKSAKQLAAANALKAISSIVSPERGTKAKEHREEVAKNNKERLGKKLAVLTAGNFEHKGKRKTLNLRQTLIEMAKAARVGGTVEQLSLTGVLKRFNWSTIEAPVRAYAATLDEEQAKTLLAVLYPVAVEQPEPAAKPLLSSDQADSVAKASLGAPGKPAPKKGEGSKRRDVQPVRKAG